MSRPATAPESTCLTEEAQSIIDDVVASVTERKRPPIASTSDPTPTPSLLKPFVTEHRPLNPFLFTSKGDSNSFQTLIAHRDSSSVLRSTTSVGSSEAFRDSKRRSEIERLAEHKSAENLVAAVPLHKVKAPATPVFTPMFGTPGRAVQESEMLLAQTRRWNAQCDAVRDRQGGVGDTGGDDRKKRLPRATIGEYELNRRSKQVRRPDADGLNEIHSL